MSSLHCAAATARSASRTAAHTTNLRASSLAPRAPRPPARRCLRAAASHPHDGDLDADTALFNAQFSAVLRRRIQEVRQAEARAGYQVAELERTVADSVWERPELPSTSAACAAPDDVRLDHELICNWHEEQWEKLRAAVVGGNDYDQDLIQGS